MRFSRRTIIRTAFAAVVAAASTPVAIRMASAQTAGKPMTTASGLQTIDSVVGTGASPKPGQICVMHYTGWLYENGQKGKKFDSSVDRNEPFEFPIGKGRVIAGWDETRRRVMVVDPYQPNPWGPSHEYWIGVDRVVAAILLGIVTHDANLLVVYPRHRNPQTP